MAKRLAASQEGLSSTELVSLRAHRCVHTCPSWLCILRQTNTSQTLPYSFSKTCLNSIYQHIDLPSGLFLSGFLAKALHAFLTLTSVLHNLARSHSYIIYQTVILSTPMCKKFPRWIIETNTSLSQNI
jgi:hypothetical protein